MKRFLVIIVSIFLSIIFFPKLKAENYTKYNENLYTLEFDNLSSNSINYIFSSLNGLIIEFEIEIKNVSKTYMINLNMTDDLQQEVTKKVVKSLEEDNLRELSSIASIKGFKIKSIKLRCTLQTLDIIKDRSKHV